MQSCLLDALREALLEIMQFYFQVATMKVLYFLWIISTHPTISTMLPVQLLQADFASGSWGPDGHTAVLKRSWVCVRSSKIDGWCFVESKVKCFLVFSSTRGSKIASVAERIFASKVGSLCVAICYPLTERNGDLLFLPNRLRCFKRKQCSLVCYLLLK